MQYIYITGNYAGVKYEGENIIKTAKLENGEKVWLAEDATGGWIFFEDDEGEFDEASGQSVPKDSLDYRYTHGGRLYREACEKLEVL